MPLELRDCHHLRAAQGGLELGNPAEANEELEPSAPEFRAHPEMLEIRCPIYAHAIKWDACVDMAAAILKFDPKRLDASTLHGRRLVS